MTGDDELAVAGTLLAADTLDRTCTSRAIMDQVTTRWGTLIIAALIKGPHRFSQLHVRVDGISQKMLSHNLKTLVRAGLVNRDVEPTVPPQVTYSLTPMGMSLATPLTQLIHWFGQNASGILEAQAGHDRQADELSAARH
ncbi:helix-turn-helix domain-containing protein [Kineosporia sp. NBRC 101731]|uniref:winged helix-turn-helix transcriptional regulator n=1 Tax=Kineosporia sp. NBRC 101731 TaxID=3032199 RepID=UPI0024A02437|nr:helix-turn-helix domain-containing protein [Kineosporia sp. NBRC 101731]GLY29030.1 transcriptional regulator [Kineosporia sp. NBRC 101731]